MPIKTLTFSKKLTVLFVLLFTASCAHSKGWVYKPSNYSEVIESSKLENKTIVVLPFTDKRSNDNTNATLIYMIPLVPFGYADLSTPESVPMHANSGLWVNYNPKDDFAKAVVEELNSTKILKEAFFANSVKDSDYYVSGEILSTDYHSKLFSYGLSIYGPLLWFIGLPASYVANDLEIKLSLIDTKSKKAVFSKVYKANHYGKVGWIYFLPNDFKYSEMLADLYKQFLTDLMNDKNVDHK